MLPAMTKYGMASSERLLALPNILMTVSPSELPPNVRNRMPVISSDIKMGNPRKIKASRTIKIKNTVSICVLPPSQNAPVTLSSSPGEEANGFLPNTRIRIYS